VSRTSFNLISVSGKLTSLLLIAVEIPVHHFLSIQQFLRTDSLGWQLSYYQIDSATVTGILASLPFG
jgi:hypothetical protein